MKDNKFVGEAFVSMMDDGNADRVAMAREVVKDCEGTTDSDRCEAGAKICKCLSERSTARGLN